MKKFISVLKKNFILIALVVIPLGIYFFLNQHTTTSCARNEGDNVTVKLVEKVGEFTCGWDGIKITAEYAHSVYLGDDGCNYIMTDKRVIRYKENKSAESYWYAAIREGDTIQGEVENRERSLTHHGIVVNNSSNNVACGNYTVNLRNPEAIRNAIGLHHHH